MTDVVLVNAPHSFLGTHKSEPTSTDLKSGELFFYPPLGILYLASALRSRGYDVAVLDAPTLQVTVEDLTFKILSYDPKILALSATTPQARSAVQLARAVRDQRYIKTVLGGSHATLDQNFIAKYPYFDMLFQGEGEVTFPQMIDSIKAGTFDGQVIKGENAKDLDSLPFPARDLTDLDAYFLPVYKERFTSLLSSRGCPYNCSFCSRPCVSRTIRFRSPQNVYDEMQECKEQYNIEHFQFVDDIFGVDRKRTLELLGLLGNVGIQFGFQTRVELLQDEAYVKALAEAGCRGVSLGIESGDEEVRRLNGKPFTDSMVKQAIRICHKHNLEVNSFYVIGLIGENESTITKSIHHPQLIDTDYIEFHVIIPFPATEVFDYAVKEGVFDSDVWDRYISGSSTEQPIYVPKTLTREFMLQAQKNAYRKFYFNPRYIARRFCKDFVSLRKLRQDARTAMVLAKNFGWI